MNGDGVVSGIGDSVQGYNIFAYCFNNPVNMGDRSGNWPQWLENAAKAIGSFVAKAKAVFSIPSTITKIAIASTVSVVSKQATVDDVVNDIKNYNFFNTDESKVLNSKVFSSYEGTPVLRHSIPGITSFSISNTIVLNRNSNGIDTVRHEWGHTVQQSLMGTPKYINRIAIPSIAGNLITRNNPNPKLYYSLPWEYSADFFGGVERSSGYYEGSDIVGGIYFLMP